MIKLTNLNILVHVKASGKSDVTNANDQYAAQHKKCFEFKV